MCEQGHEQQCFVGRTNRYKAFMNRMHKIPFSDGSIIENAERSRVKLRNIYSIESKNWDKLKTSINCLDCFFYLFSSDDRICSPPFMELTNACGEDTLKQIEKNGIAFPFSMFLYFT